jgi:hypothetical protein
MMADGDENNDDSVSVSFYSQKRMPMPIQIQAKSTTLLRFRTVTEESKLTNRHSKASFDRPPPTRPGRQAIRANCHITVSVPYNVPWGGGGRGMPQKGKGGGGVQV